MGRSPGPTLCNKRKGWATRPALEQQMLRPLAPRKGRPKKPPADSRQVSLTSAA